MGRYRWSSGLLHRVQNWLCVLLMKKVGSAVTLKHKTVKILHVLGTRMILDMHIALKVSNLTLNVILHAAWN
jgi:hypothetical protein